MSIIRDITLKSRKYLDTDEILILIGARQAGKTTILKQIQFDLENQNKICHFLNLEDPEYLDLLNKTPRNLFKILPLDLTKKSYVIIDEVQYLKNPSNFLKFIYDEYNEKIKLIASGSSAFYLDKKFKDSLAGRKRIFHVYTLSFGEFLRFKKEDDLAQKNFTNLALVDKNKIGLYFREYMLYGGYPRVVLASFEEKKEILKELAYSYIKKDIYESGVRQEDVFYKLFKVLAGQVGGLVNSSELANTLGVSKPAIDNYLRIMQKSFHLALIRPLFRNLRKEISKMPKIYYLDLGLRNFFADNFEAFDLRKDKGQVLENSVFRQLIEKGDKEEIKFWRTISQKEIDFIEGNTAYEVKAVISRPRQKYYDTFLQAYPDIAIKYISIDKSADSIADIPVLDIWEL